MEVISCTTTEEFLDLLSPRAGKWQKDRGASWIFRGQADATWKLIPKALRENELIKFLDKTAHLERTADGQMFLEWLCLNNFVNAVNRQGTMMPDYNMEFDKKWFNQDSPEMNKMYKLPNLWPTDEIIPLLAFAQHAGLPTRLLDWTRRSYIAAYFAASGAAMNNRENPVKIFKEIAVWAFDSSKLSYIKTVEKKNVPSGLNTNLYLQSGCFTIVRENAGRGEPMEKRGLEEIIDDSWKLPEEKPLIKITLPGAKAPQLLYQLFREGIDGASMFAGTEGALKSVREVATF